jgi:hypothetical protein
MTLCNSFSRCAAVLVIALTTGSRLWAAESDNKPDPAQLQRNLHEMRAVIERERAQQDATARANTTQLRADSLDAPGIGTMRAQLTQSLQHLENRCFGIDMNVKDGNAILICGNNNGSADNSTVKSTSQTTVLLPQPVQSPASSESQSQSGEGK